MTTETAGVSPDIHDRYQAVCERNRELFETVGSGERRCALGIRSRLARRGAARVRPSLRVR